MIIVIYNILSDIVGYKHIYYYLITNTHYNINYKYTVNFVIFLKLLFKPKDNDELIYN